MAKIFIEQYSDGWMVRREGVNDIHWPIEFCLTKRGAIRAAKRYIKIRNRKPKRIDIGEIDA